MNAARSLLLSQPFAAALLIAASVALTLGFACAVPLAAFAVVASLSFNRAGAAAVMIGVWLANQIIGFAVLHYPTDPSTLAWGVALGGVALLSLAVANAVLTRRAGPLAMIAAFVAAFVAYQGSIIAVAMLGGNDVSYFTLDVLARVVAINAVTLAGLLAVRAVALRLVAGASDGFLRHA